MIWWVELIGYLGMLLIVIAFLCKNVKLLRILDSIGAFLCFIYGILTRTTPTAILNIIIVTINISILIITYIKQKRKVN